MTQVGFHSVSVDGGRIAEPITGDGAGAGKQGGYDVAHTRHRR